MSTFLFEIGVEELPARFVGIGQQGLQTGFEKLLKSARIEYASMQTYGTPRRLAVIVDGIAAAQSDRDELIVGPPCSIGFKDGEPTKAATGFAKKNGVTDVANIVKEQTAKGEYVAVRVQEKGAPSSEVLPSLLAELCASLKFPKSMRWGNSEISFARPVQWLLALFDDKVIPCSFAGQTSGNETLGHRFLGKKVAVKRAEDYIEQLRGEHVMVDEAERRETLLAGLTKRSSELGLSLEQDADLVAECANLVEWPFVVEGGFDKRYLELPEAVTISVMRDHQRYFALRDSEGKLANTYLNAANTAKAPALIRVGNDRVLRARLEDASFFVVEDKKTPLADRVTKLDAITFQKRLGSVGDKVRRFSKVAEAFAQWSVNAPALCSEDVRKVSSLAKTDLTTQMVFEFTELQGMMGRYYADGEKMPGEIGLALEQHYWPTGSDAALPETELASIVAIADRIDTIVGCFGIGLKPSGSADPFALRRAAVGIARIAIDGNVDVNLGKLVAVSIDAFDGIKFDFGAAELQAQVEEFFATRLTGLLHQASRGDIPKAALAAWKGDSLRDLAARTRALYAFVERESFDALSTAFKRAQNITKDGFDSTLVDAALLSDDAEKNLVAALERVSAQIDSAVAGGDYNAALDTIAEQLSTPVIEFFDKVFVMDEDLGKRASRLSLLADLVGIVERIAHFHVLS